MASEIGKLKVDHLILLVGGNPLPNYVAARLMAHPKATLHFVCSRGAHGTRPIAEAVAEALKLPLEQDGLSGNFRSMDFVEVDERNAHSIVSKIEALLKDPALSGSVGLNYTGGTKPMAVHSYRALEHADIQDVRYSYLDPSSLTMYVHDADGNIMAADRADTFNMPLERLLKMHSISLINLPKSKPIALELAGALAQLHATPAGSELWRQVCRDKSKCWTELPPGQPELAEVEAAWRKMCNDNLPTPEGVARALKFDKLSSCAKYFKGEWLEDHTLAELQKAIEGRSDCVDACATVNGLRTLSATKVQDEFDLDVVVMRTYQLLTFSCIVSADTTACKEHLAEVFVRARHMGGDEARVGLVCTHDKPKKLQEKIEGALDAHGKVKVFGAKHLPQLAARITDWLDEQGKEHE